MLHITKEGNPTWSIAKTTSLTYQQPTPSAYITASGTGSKKDSIAVGDPASKVHQYDINPPMQTLKEGLKEASMSALSEIFKEDKSPASPATLVTTAQTDLQDKQLCLAPIPDAI